MFKTLLDKVKVWLDNKAEEAYPLNDGPDSDIDTQREMPSKDEDTRRWIKIIKFKF